jgi:Uncharacterised protein conserved in bacteria (DUF2336)
LHDANVAAHRRTRSRTYSGTNARRIEMPTRITDLFMGGASRFSDEEIGAFDDDIDVARPLLTHSERLDDRALLASASTKSQRHLLAPSQRKSLSEAVTDVLVKRGDRSVTFVLQSIRTNRTKIYSTSVREGSLRPSLARHRNTNRSTVAPYCRPSPTKASCLSLVFENLLD